MLSFVAAETLLGAQELVPGKPFTDPGHTARDAQAMRELLARERERARAWGRGRGPRPEEVVSVERDEEGRRHLLVVPDTRTLLEARRPTVVGFFGTPRDEVDHSILFELEDELVASMSDYAGAGLLSYYDVELVKGSYGNVILFSTPDVPREWHDNPVHLRAIEISPGHYRSIRLHRGSLAGRLLDGGELTLERTRYLDFEPEVPWRAVRPFAPLAG
jgi:hypothetical protein